jgi:HPt (histidine-containing phosphotransfer) domain-containing protein
MSAAARPDHGPAEDAIDRAHLARQTGGDAELAREVLGLFRDQCARQFGLIAAAGPGQASRDAAHTLVGAARGIGAFGVAAAAGALEAAPPEDHDAALAALERAIASAQAELARIRDAPA